MGLKKCVYRLFMCIDIVNIGNIFKCIILFIIIFYNYILKFIGIYVILIVLKYYFLYLCNDFLK